jgi:hypothetical protein
MGREIRRVPPNWSHPRDERGEYRPCFDHDYETAAEQWIAEFDQWRAGTHPHQQGEYASTCRYFWDYDAPPDEETCRPKFEQEPTWWQVYQTVSEGSPVTPPFATPEELIDYLVQYGDFWDQQRGEGGWRREAAEAFVKSGYAPSGIVSATTEGVEILTARDSDRF